MKTKRNIICSIAIAFYVVLFLNACNKNKIEQTKHIPKDANLVVCINSTSIYSKLKDHKEEIDSLVKSFADNSLSSDSTETTGELAMEAFDLKQPIFFFTKTTNSIAEGKSLSTGFLLEIKDKSKLEELVKTISKNATINQGEGFSYAAGERHIFGWTNTLAICIPTFGYTDNSASLELMLANLFNMKESESIAENKMFTKSFTTNADVSYYTSSAQLLSTVPMLALSKASDLFKDMYSAGTVNFNDGSIDIDGTSYPNSTLMDLIKKNPSSTFSEKTLENYPGQPAGILDISFNPKQIVNIISFIGFDQMINSFLQKQGLSLDDIAAAFKGEIAVAVSKIRQENTSVPGANFTSSSPKADYLFLATIADKKAYDKLINIAANLQPGAFVNKNGQLVPNAQGTGMAYTATDQYVATASSQGLLDSFTSAKGKVVLPDEIEKNIKGKTFFLYGDLQNIFNAIPIAGNDSGFLVTTKNTFKDVVAWRNAVSGSSISGEAHIHFVDAKQNSIISLLKFAQQIKQYQDKHKASADSSSVISDSNMDTNIPVPANVDTTVK